MNQVEFLLRLSENAREKGDDIARRHHDERAAHGKELQELWRMIELARQNVWTELTRFGIGNEAPKEGERPQVQQGFVRSIAAAGNSARAPARPAEN